MAHLVAKGTQGNLHQAVGQGEDAHHPSPAALIDAEVGFDLHARKGDASAIEESDDAEDDEEGEDGIFAGHSVWG